MLKLYVIIKNIGNCEYLKKIRSPYICIYICDVTRKCTFCIFVRVRRNLHIVCYMKIRNVFLLLKDFIFVITAENWKNR